MANRGENMETVTDFIFLGSKITADGDCSHEIKRRLLLGRKVMTNLDSSDCFLCGKSQANRLYLECVLGGNGSKGSGLGDGGDSL